MAFDSTPTKNRFAATAAIWLRGGSLRVRVQADPHPDDLEYAYYLHYNHVLTERQWYTGDPWFRRDGLKPGAYQVQVFIKGRSETWEQNISFFTDEVLYFPDRYIVAHTGPTIRRVAQRLQAAPASPQIHRVDSLPPRARGHLLCDLAFLVDPGTSDPANLTQTLDQEILNILSDWDPSDIIVVEHRYAEQYLTDDGLLADYSGPCTRQIANANAQLAAIYRFARERLPEAAFIDFSRFMCDRAQAEDLQLKRPTEDYLQRVSAAICALVCDDQPDRVRQALSAPHVPVQFWPTPSPFLDFVLIAVRPEHLARLDSMATRLKALKLDVVQLPTYGPWRTYCVVPHERAESITPELIFSGYGVMGTRFFADPSEPLPADVSAGGTGYYCYAKIAPAQIDLGTDLSGAATLLYHRAPGYCLIANRYHLLLLVMRAFGVYMVLDRDRIYLNLFRQYVFSEQNFPGGLPVKGISMIPPTHTATLGEDGLRLTQYWDYAKPDIAFDRDRYDELLDRAAEELVAGARAILESGRFGTYAVDITGGVDSRIMVAALSRVPGWRDKVRGCTFPIHQSRDVQIGCEIANYFGLSYLRKEYPPLRYVTHDESRAIHRSYCMGLRYNLQAPGHWSADGAFGDGDRPILELTGMFGESYRAYGVSFPEKPTLDEYVREIVGTEPNYSPFVSHAELGHILRRLLLEFDGTPADRAANLYYQGRMRTNHGMTVLASHESLPLMHLVSPSLLAASKSLPADLWIAGVAELDVVERLCFPLAWLHLDDKDFLIDMRRELYPEAFERFTAMRLDFDSDESDWLAAREFSARSERAAFGELSAEEPEPVDEWARLCVEGYYRLASQNGDVWRVLFPGFRTMLEAAARGGVRLRYDTTESFFRKLYIKLYSFLDQAELTAVRE